MNLDVRSLTFQSDEGPPVRGQMTLAFEDLAEFKAAVARLHAGRMLFDGGGQAHWIRLSDEEVQAPSYFPAEVPLSVCEEPLPDGSPARRMRLGNNYLQAGTWIEVVQFDPPGVDGSSGLLRVCCDNQDAYDLLVRLLDERHGSALSAADGSGQWYIGRDGELASPDDDFPKTVSVRIRDLRPDD